MNVGVASLRANLSEWLDRVAAGDEVVVTDRGTPVARIVGVDSASALVELEERGVISRPAEASRPKAAGRRRARSTAPVSELVSEQRD